MPMSGPWVGWSPPVLCQVGDPMDRVEAELFTDGGNDAVVRLPGRRFPGVLIRGDSLHTLRSDVAEATRVCGCGDLADAAESAGVVSASLDANCWSRAPTSMRAVCGACSCRTWVPTATSSTLVDGSVGCHRNRSDWADF
ncbi:DUF6959 family protein [Streptomyces sp. NPDC002285]